MKRQRTLKQAVEAMFRWAKRKKLRRVKDPVRAYEYKDNGREVCAVCIYGLKGLARDRGVIDSHEDSALSIALNREFGHRGDDPRELRTVRNMRAVRKFYDDAVKHVEEAR